MGFGNRVIKFDEVGTVVDNSSGGSRNSAEFGQILRGINNPEMSKYDRIGRL